MYFKNTIFAILFFLLFGFINGIHAQLAYPQKNIPSPNAFAFSKYGNHTANLSNGLLNFGISLFELPFLDRTLKCNLNYDASGFRPDVFPSWVGSNWNLDIGGMISRKVVGLPDEFSFVLERKHYWDNGVVEKRHYRNGFMHNYRDNSMTANNILRASNPYYTGISGGNMYRVNHTLPYLADHVDYLNPIFSNTYGGADGTYWVRKLGESGATGFYQDNFLTWETTEGGGMQDIFPDEFNFNVMGISGKFYFKRNGPYSASGNISDWIVVECSEDIIVTPAFKSQEPTSSPVTGDEYFSLNVFSLPFVPQTCGDWSTANNRFYNYSPWNRAKRFPSILTGFTIRTKSGYSFTFGKNEPIAYQGNINVFKNLAIDVSTNLYSCKDLWTADTWYLTSVNYKGNFYNFEYERDPFIAQKYNGLYSETVDGTLDLYCYNNADEGVYYKAGRLISPVTLKRIYGHDVEVVFQRSESVQKAMNIDFNNSPVMWNSNFYPDLTKDKRYKLDKIIVNNQGHVNSINFTYCNSPTERLRLCEIRMKNKLNADYEKYTFEYNRNLSEPEYLANQNDHWGFWNGVTTDVPMHISIVAALKNLKVPVFENTQFNILKKVVYPGGGYSTFEYEQNKVSKSIMADGYDLSLIGNSNVGGLRLKRTMDYDYNDKLANEKTFIYLNEFENNFSESMINESPSSGILNSSIDYLWQQSSSKVVNQSPVNLQSFVSGTVTVLSYQPLYYTNGYHVNYSSVYIVNKDLSYEKFVYTNHDNGFGNEPPVRRLVTDVISPFDKMSDLSKDRGHLLKNIKYNNLNKQLYELSNEYIRKKRADMLEYYALKWFGNAVFDGGCGGYIPSMPGFKFITFGSEYKFYNHYIVVAKVTEKSFSEENVLTNQTLYEYGSELHPYPTKVSKINSKNEILNTYYKYAADFNNEFMYRRLVEKEHNIIVEEKNTKVINGVEFITDAKLFEHGLAPHAPKTWLRALYKLDLEAPIQLNSYTDADFITRSFKGPELPKDLRYSKLFEFNNYNNNDELKAGEKVHDLYFSNTFSNNGNSIIGDVKGSVRPHDFSLISNTSFEKISKLDLNNNPVNIFDNEDDFSYVGNSTDEYSYTGKHAFNGYVQTKSMIYDGTIYLAVKNNGNLPTIQRISTCCNDILPVNASFTKVFDKGNGWSIYKASFNIGGGFMIRINTNNNFIDELRFYPLNYVSVTKTFTYLNGKLSTTCDDNFNVEKYTYNNENNLLFIKDDKGNILKKYDYKYQQPQ